MNKPLIEQLRDYARCATPEQIALVDSFVQLLTEKPACFGRQPGGHITASAWVINPDNTAALLTHHKKLNKWLQLGGHSDDNPDVRDTALREAQEESGIQEFSFIIPGIFDIDIHAIPGACAWHYDVRFLLKAHQDKFLVSDESHNLAWVPFENIQNYAQEESVLRMNTKYQDLA